MSGIVRDGKNSRIVHNLRILEATYKCNGCGGKQKIHQEGEYLKAPISCPKCPSKSFTLISEESEFEDLGIAGLEKES